MLNRQIKNIKKSKDAGVPSRSGVRDTSLDAAVSESFLDQSKVLSQVNLAYPRLSLSTERPLTLFRQEASRCRWTVKRVARRVLSAFCQTPPFKIRPNR